MLHRALPILGLLALTGCPSFSFGPEAFDSVVDDTACDAVGLPSGCSRFELDNGEVFVDDETPQPLRVAFDYETRGRNLTTVTLSYEQPGATAVEAACDIDGGQCQSESSDVQGSVSLADSYLVDLGDLGTAERGTVVLDLEVLADTAGPHAFGAWLTDSNDFESPTVRVEFEVLAAPDLDPDRG